MDYRILPPEELIEDGLVDLPLSKSLLNRQMILAALTEGCKLPPESPSGESDDIMVMRAAVESVLGCGNAEEIEINAGESGTALRFLTALVASRPGCTAVITGLPGLKRRPVGPLVEVLKACGATIRYLDREGYAPLKVSGCQLIGGEFEVDATVSSQFVSALLMVAPTMMGGLVLKFNGEPASLPYIKMTAAMMRARGVEVELAPLMAVVGQEEYQLPAVGSAGYYTGPGAAEMQTEADWSAAAFWYEVSALTAGWISLRGLRLPGDSIQGDAVAAKFFDCLGVQTEESEEIPGALALTPSPEVFGRLDLDLVDYPDLAPALTVTCCMLGVPFRFVGLKSLSIKESDRLQALVDEMDKVGCTLEKIRDFGLEWEGKRHPLTALPEFETHGDHRLAMAFAPAAAYIPGIIVKDAGCVAKSYPGFWDALRGLGFRTLDPDEPVDTEGGEVAEG